jgi:hypothetical protein
VLSGRLLFAQALIGGSVEAFHVGLELGAGQVFVGERCRVGAVCERHERDESFCAAFPFGPDSVGRDSECLKAADVTSPVDTRVPVECLGRT